MTATAELIATCETCTNPIADGQGFLWVDLGEAMDRWRTYCEWRKANDRARFIPIGTLTELPDETPWRVHHIQGCDPGPAGNSYSIEISRVRTFADLLRWTGHLAGKNWLESTDWMELIQSVAAGTDRRLRIAQKEAAA